MANKTSFKSGQSGNPKGRPPKCRALTAILEAAGNDKCSDGAGGEISRKRLLARMIWQAATSGQVTFHATNREWGGSRTFDFTAADWFEFVKWLFNQVDGELVMNITEGGDEEAEDEKPPGDSDIKPQIYLPENGRETQENSPDAAT